MSWPDLAFYLFVPLLPVAAIGAAVALGLRYRALRDAARRPPKLPSDAHGAGPLVLPAPRVRRLLGILATGAYALVGLCFLLSFAAAVALALILVQADLNLRCGRRLELDPHGFTLGEKRNARRVRWLHVTEFRADPPSIRFRLNRALVRSSHVGYWDGTIRNSWGVETGSLLRLLEAYRKQALESAPPYLTGRREASP